MAALLVNTGQPEPVVAAGILHDVVEDTDARLEDVRARFGDEVAAIVGAVTEDPEIPEYERRKAALRRSMAEGGPATWAVYAADKVAKARELRAELARRGPAVTDGTAERRRAHYWASVETLERVAPIGPLVRQLRFELELLDAAPPG